MCVSSVSNGRTGRFSHGVGARNARVALRSAVATRSKQREEIVGRDRLYPTEPLSETERGFVRLAVEVLQLDHLFVAVLQLLAEVVDVPLVLFELLAEVFGLEL